MLTHFFIFFILEMSHGRDEESEYMLSPRLACVEAADSSV